MKLLIFTLGFFSFVSVLATEQIKDKLVLQKDTFLIDSPMDTFNNKDFNDKILRINKKMSSGCWRGIIYTWTITNDSLFIIETITKKLI